MIGDFDEHEQILQLTEEIVSLTDEVEDLKSQLSNTVTLRDQLAMAALTGFCADENFQYDALVKLSYEVADAMLEERKK